MEQGHPRPRRFWVTFGLWPVDVLLLDAVAIADKFKLKFNYRFNTYSLI